MTESILPPSNMERPELSQMLTGLSATMSCILSGQKDRGPVYWAVDPGTHTGLVAWDPVGKRFLGAGTYHPLRAAGALMASLDPHQDVIWIEDPGAVGAIWTAGKRNMDGASQRKMSRVSQNVGGNKAVAQVLVDMFRSSGAIVVPVDPRRRGSKKWKTEREWVAYIQGTKLVAPGGLDLVIGKTSEHARDAAMYVLGETRRPVFFEQTHGPRRL